MHTLFHNSTTRRFLENLTKHEGRAESAHLSPLCCETRITDLCTWHLFQLNQKELNLVGFFNLNILRIVVNWSGHQKIHIKYSHVYEYLHLFLCWWWMPILCSWSMPPSHTPDISYFRHTPITSLTHILYCIYIYFPRCTVYSIHIFLHLVVLQYHILYITCILSIPDSCTVLHRFITPRCTKQIPKVVSASWRKEFIQFLASLAFLHQDNWTNRMMSS